MILTLSLTSGCATYIKSRANDLADCFTARVGLTYGLGIRAEVTDYLGASVGGCYEKEKIGYFGRDPVKYMGVWAGVPVMQVIWPALGLFLAVGPEGTGEGIYSMGRVPTFFAPLLSTNITARFNNPSEPFSGEGSGAFHVLGVNIASLTPSETTREVPIAPEAPLLRQKFFIEFGAALGVVGFDAGFNPVEFVDFLLGWTTLDITGDD